MNRIIRSLIYNRNSLTLFKEQKRFAGHSKWQNIKHIKAAKDAQRASLFNQFFRRMRVAIADGGSANPFQNSKLAQIIEQGKKLNVPQGTINTFLQKVQSEKPTTVGTIEVKGPGGCIILIQLVSSNLPKIKMELNSVFRKNRVSLADHKSKGIFTHKGVIITNVAGDLDTATEHAIQVGAEDVQEIEGKDKQVYQFTCDPFALASISNKLEALKYSIISVDEEYMPNISIELNDEELQAVSKLYDKLESIDEVMKLYDNIA